MEGRRTGVVIKGWEEQLLRIRKFRGYWVRIFTPDTPILVLRINVCQGK